MDNPKTYLVFLQNLKTGEDFVAPATAESQGEALLAVGEKYPPRLYKLQTTYSLTEIERIVADVKRWPGVATSVPQPLLQQVEKRMGAALPPMPGQQPPAPQTPVIEAIKAAEAEPATLEAHVDVIEEAPVAIAPVEPKAEAPKVPLRTVAASIVARHSAEAVADEPGTIH
ncbi:MAG TPA: hypothetical protein VHP58_02840 [Alphaproteobacteria bacterium]|nr:hypothetical protein [Alphaproteobacteria bacterium]